jgi:predicted Na+-dependent transporter
MMSVTDLAARRSPSQAPPADHEVVTQFEQIMLVALVFVIMFGLGASLTPRDFVSALRRPWGLIIGWVTQFGIMPLLAFCLVLGLLLQLPPEIAAPLALGALLMGSVPAGTTSNIFTYFSKGNLALSVMMTTNSTLWALVMTPLALLAVRHPLHAGGSWSCRSRSPTSSSRSRSCWSPWPSPW